VEYGALIRPLVNDILPGPGKGISAGSAKRSDCTEQAGLRGCPGFG
jgi:hypothetical protein